ncbi:permease (plasmid) [Amycolatopsis sp. FU40]|uniref:permease n=1 Tax=Amycolatopsis sp. FU40 TaxID=2914159 RepID=UPI001F3CD2F5|nr:permease [Amycolatopsis sp. FU40]UKD50736.1 permease [Amycolatopsis sp. FU40]
MTSPDELSERVAALEHQVGELRALVRGTAEDAAAARVLARGADRDVSEFRRDIRDFRKAATSSFNAQRDDLRDLREQMTNGFTEMRGKLDAAAAGHEQLVALLTRALGETEDDGRE